MYSVMMQYTGGFLHAAMNCMPQHPYEQLWCKLSTVAGEERRRTDRSIYACDLDDVGVVEAGEEGDLGVELVLEDGAAGLVALRDADHLDGDGALLVDAAVDAAVGAGGELVADEELGQVGHPLLPPPAVPARRPALAGGPHGRVQQHRPRLHAVPPLLLHVVRVRRPRVLPGRRRRPREQAPPARPAQAPPRRRLCRPCGWSLFAGSPSTSGKHPWPPRRRQRRSCRRRLVRLPARPRQPEARKHGADQETHNTSRHSMPKAAGRHPRRRRGDTPPAGRRAARIACSPDHHHHAGINRSIDRYRRLNPKQSITTPTRSLEPHPPTLPYQIHHGCHSPISRSSSSCFLWLGTQMARKRKKREKKSTQRKEMLLPPPPPLLW
uniref:Uncharacterized protein n=1 Tax=Oryza brachyantha TaxID=4533 RepID=J3MG37_ORYBR